MLSPGRMEAARYRRTSSRYHGQRAVARFWLSVLPKTPRPLTFTLAEINGSPALVFWDEDQVVGILSLTLSVTGIQEIYALLNPAKLVYLRTQLSGRGTASEASKRTGPAPDQR